MALANALLLILFVLSPLVATAAEERADELYRALGERSGIVQIVDVSARLWLADSRIAATFEESNMDRLKQHLTDQICELSGGPCRYGGHDMRHAHRGLHLTIAQFNALTEDLQQAMEMSRVPYDEQNVLLAFLAPMERDVVGR